MNFLQPQKRRVYQLKKKTNGKGSYKHAQKEILNNRILPNGNEEEFQVQDLQKWAMKSIGLLRNGSEWGNDKKDGEWIETQKKIQESLFVDMNKLTKGLQKDYKIVLLQAPDESPLLQAACNEATPFADTQFLPNQLSLTGEWGFMQKYKNVYWKRASQEIKNCTIFNKKISPQDVIQGKLGDCYFLAGMAALAERPDRIFNLFLVRQINKNRHFSVKILVKGKWRIVDLDEFLPFQNHKPVFSHAQQNALWVMILEKAWAKIYNCYMGISSGHVEQILHDFTGAPIKFYKLKDKDNLETQSIWNYLLKASKKEYAMCASSNVGSDEKMSQTGIVQGHAYTLLNATNMLFQGKTVRLLQLRNPWGRKENNGRWGDKDPNWKKVSTEEKNRLMYFETVNDGVFYMQFEDFIREYRAVTIAQINDNSSYVYQSLKDPNIEGVFFKVEIKENGLYSLQVDKTPQRFFTSKKQIGYKYPKGIVKIYSSSQYYKEIHHFQDRQRLTSRRISLFKGLYIVFVFIDFNKNYEKGYDVTLAIYSEAPATIEIANKSDIKQISVPNIAWQNPKRAGTKSQPKSQQREGSQEKKVKLSIRFNYLSPSKEYFQPVSNEQLISDRIIQAVKMQIKTKRTKKGQVVHIGGKKGNQSQQDNNNNNNKNWGNHIEGQQWINKQAQNDSSTFIDGVGKSLSDVINKQVTFIEPCPQDQKVQESKLVNKDFIDQRFPPSLNSLTGQWGTIQEWKNVKWQRISKIMPNAKIFQGEISPQSIKQGFLGDCYFLAGIAAIAERPDRIFNLFLEHERNSANSYSVKMLYKGKWLTISMDDYIPYMYDLPAFSRANKDELWVILLQKAWAKIYSSFKRIQAGFPQETLHDLTGAPIRHIYLQRSTFDMGRQWDYLMNASDLEYAMVASSQAGSDQLKSLSGIVQGHAYTLLKVTEISINNSFQRLVQLRNPWGKGESSGRWGDNDPIWNAVDEKTKAKLGYSRKDDGIFFMTYESFCKQFKIITIAEINDNASYVYKSTKDPQKNGCFFKVEILQKGKYSFQVDSTPQRTFEIKYNTNYRYPYIKFELGMMTDKGYIKRITSTEQNSRTSFYVSDCEVGVYICYVRIDFDSNFQKDCDVNLAIYGDYVSYVDLASKKQAILFSNNPNIKWADSQTTKKGEVQWNGLRGYRRDRRSR